MSSLSFVRFFRLHDYIIDEKKRKEFDFLFKSVSSFFRF